MAFQSILPSVPCLCIFLLLIGSLLSPSHARCKCSDSEQDRMEIGSTSSTFMQQGGYLLTQPLYSINNSISNASMGNITFLPGGLSSNRSKNYSASDPGWYFVPQEIFLWGKSHDGTILDASFNVSFTMSIYRPVIKVPSLVFSILDKPDIFQVPGSSPSSTHTKVDGIDCSVQIGTNVSSSTGIVSTIWVNITIDVPAQDNKAPIYSVWIDYNRLGHHVRVYVDKYNTGQLKPYIPIVEVPFDISRTTLRWGLFGFSSSMGQLLQLETWSMTAEQPPWTTSSKGRKPSTVTILSSVLGSVVAPAMTAVAVYYYFNSKYRKWTKEQDKLAKAMQSLPGVPTQIVFADIKKATKNFDEKMRLGKGGFGSVYGCTLPAVSSNTGQPIQVAVKKFMRAVEDRRYNDFLAEVSIINRLRHRNIVALVGWSYNKGEPLLVYEYMTNGSLDQHLFRRGSNQHQHQDATIKHWDTRYAIAWDIATGLHYVHHEHEPMVLHRDIKASNIMLDSAFRARLGDFGIACTVAEDRSSVTGVVGTWGYIAPEYAMSHRATRQTDIYAFGVLILEIVSGKTNREVPLDDGHISDWVWRLHGEMKLMEAVDSVLTSGDGQLDIFADEAKRLLLLGLACTNPNPSNRPSMAEVVQVITKLVSPPDIPLERPTFLWPPEDWRARNSVYSTVMSNWDSTKGSCWDGSTLELVPVSQE